MRTIVAFSGGKDSTAMALRLAELGESFDLLFTPTGNELPELMDHIAKIVEMTGATLVTPPNKPLDFWITSQEALPNWRQRWCTRLIKIEPCIAYLVRFKGSTLCVGLRADEPQREGLYGPYATYRYPLREWSWGIGDVKDYLRQRCVKVPKRTDCALCYGQRISEWHALWRDHPEEYAKGEAYEKLTGFTFRSKQRDTWPPGLAELRVEFEKGRKPKNVDDQLDMFDEGGACRVCTI